MSATLLMGGGMLFAQMLSCGAAVAAAALQQVVEGAQREKFGKIPL